MQPLKHTHEPVTVWLPKAQVAELTRRVLESPRGRWDPQRPRSKADLVREAVAKFLQPGEVAIAIAGPKAKKRPADEPFSFYVHHRRKGTEHASTCGLSGLADEALTSHAPNATCPQCVRVIKNNERALAAASKPKRAPRSAKKAKARR
jgi:hypothetical protein